MARQNTQGKKLPIRRIVEGASFAVLVFLFSFISFRAGMRWLGLMTLAGALAMAIERRIPYGWEGRDASGCITGPLALVLAIPTAAVGVAMLVQPDSMLAIFGWQTH